MYYIDLSSFHGILSSLLSSSDNNYSVTLKEFIARCQQHTKLNCEHIFKILDEDNNGILYILIHIYIYRCRRCTRTKCYHKDIDNFKRRQEIGM